MDAQRTNTAAWLVKDFADGWIPFYSQAAAEREAEGAGNAIAPVSITLTDERGLGREFRVDGPKGYVRFSLHTGLRLQSFGGETWPFAYPELFEPRNQWGEPITDPEAIKHLNLASPSWGYYVRNEIKLP